MVNGAPHHDGLRTAYFTDAAHTSCTRRRDRPGCGLRGLDRQRLAAADGSRVGKGRARRSGGANFPALRPARLFLDHDLVGAKANFFDAAIRSYTPTTGDIVVHAVGYYMVPK
jgi:hypothetical protein